MNNSTKEILKKYWGYDSFRESQEEIIQSVIEGNNTLALLPTGGGKSICYQIPALAQEGICIVISPLIALMKDQVDTLNKKGIKSIAIFSGMNKREIDIALDNCVYGDFKFLYVSPERIGTEIFIERAKKMKINLIAVDEAHCISQWGHDFRPSYQKINSLKEFLPASVPFIAVTATANNRVIQDICENIDIKKSAIVKKSFERKNLGYLVLKENAKEDRLLKIINKVNSSGIVYVNTRKNTVVVSNFLNKNGIKADFYHGGLAQQIRDEKQKKWINDTTQIIVATNAFGMGIDKPNVRVVVHMDIPSSPEAYFQEAGRAGRDGKKSFAVLLYKANDKKSLNKFHALEFPEKTEIKKIYNCLGNYFRQAIGSGEMSTFDFDLAHFCNQFNLNPLVTFHCIKILSLSEYLFLSESIFKPSSVKVTVSNSVLYEFQVKNIKYDPVIQYLLRNQEGIFDSYSRIDIPRVSKSLQLKETELKKQLLHLTKLELIEYKPASDKPILTYLKDRVHEDRMVLPKKVYLDRKEIKRQQLDFMIKYCESEQICRSKLLLSYFDETEYRDCGICDICLERKRKQISIEIYDKIEKKLITILRVTDKNIQELVEGLKEFDEKDILTVIRWKLDNDELNYTEANKLFITKKEE